MRNIASIFISLIAGVFVITCIQWVGNTLFPADIPFPEKRIEQKMYMEHVPFMAKLFILISYSAAAFVTGIVATYIQGRTDYRPILISTATIQLLIWMNMMTITHPVWMWIFTTLLVIPVGYLTFRKFRIKDETVV